MVPLRRFTASGLTRFKELLAEIRITGDADVRAIIWDDDLTDRLSREPVLKIRPFATRRDSGEYFYDLISEFEDEIPNVDRDQGLWSWLAAVWMDYLAPVENGRRKIGATARWLLFPDDYRLYYRHLLAGPYYIFRAHRADPDRAMAILATPVSSPGEVAEQLTSRQEIVSNPAFLKAATRLFYDERTKTLKRGSGSKEAGSSRRLAKDILEQFALTWDFYGMEPEQILDLLPAEFDRFRPQDTRSFRNPQLQNSPYLSG